MGPPPLTCYPHCVLGGLGYPIVYREPVEIPDILISVSTDQGFEILPVVRVSQGSYFDVFIC